jgi:thymidylate synthase (FAD)
MYVELVSKTHGVGKYEGLTSEEIVAAVARHGVIKEDNGKLVKYLMDNAHWSPLQHIFFSFRVETSRAISAQIFRHRSLNFQETSQRYQEIQEFENISLRREHPVNRQSSTEWMANINHSSRFISTNGKLSDEENQFNYEMLQLLENVESTYKKGLELGISKECMRMILPMCSKTTIHISGTLRDLMAFLNVRLDPHSQEEVREIAYEIGKILENELPGVFGQIRWREGMFM